MHRLTCSLCAFVSVNTRLARVQKSRTAVSARLSTSMTLKSLPSATFISRREISCVCSNSYNNIEQVEEHENYCCYNKPNYSTLSSNKREMKFDLSLLPLHLQEEFDVEGNKRTLRFLLSHPAKHAPKKSNSNDDNNMCNECTNNLGSSSITIVTVLPTWVYNVSWVCRQCHTEWMARPVDRINEQIAHSHNCPHCSSVHSDVDIFAVEVNTPTVKVNTNHINDVKKISPEFSSSYSSSPQHSFGSSLLLLSSYPTLAAQWDVKRNNLLPNQVVISLYKVKCNSTMTVWWSCPHCGRPWREAVNSRVARYEKWKNAHHCQSNVKSSSSSSSCSNRINNVSVCKDTTQKEELVIPLCPSCEVRGSSDKINNTRVNTQHVNSKQYLIHDNLLMSEVILRPHDDPSTTSMESEMLLNWRCRFCEYEFVASVADRALRHVRCPQCTGAVITAYNALMVQRPDVIHEMSSSISEYKLRKLTIYSPEEITFVCRRCCCPYRMTIKARCAIPKGIAACSKCFLTQSTAANKMLNTLSASNNNNEQPLTRKQRNSIKQAALRSMRTNRSNERLAYVRHALKLKDDALLN